ncbi:hypothetical protein [Yersinia enterocolitica]|uniref:hypothetical protein n=1 Tax=Yersinia enterocolitica TaxID=630 RepID=UPI003705A312
MSKIERYAGNLRAFGSNAQGLERTLFGETTQADDLTSQVTNSFLRGWGIVGPSENPSMEDFNAAMYTMSQFIAYQHQMGIPEWDALQEYYSGSICVRNGEAYLSLVDSNIGSAPPSAKWTSVLTAKNALANISGFLKISNNLSDLTNVPAALLNLGLGDAAKKNVGTASGTVAAGNDVRFNETTIIYPDGSGASPYNYPANTRKEYANPFPGKNIIVVAEVYYNGVWGQTGWFSNSTVTNAVGILATQNIVTDVIVVQSGSFGVLAASTLCGSLHAATATQSTLPFRLKVYKEA